MNAGHIGAITTPRSGDVLNPGVDWIADNGCGPGVHGHGAGYPGNYLYLRWLESHPRKSDCIFAAAPDVVGDAAATLARSAPMLPLIRRLGYTVALVAQDGLESLTIDWDTFDVMFLGGTTNWKLGPAANALTRLAHRHHKPVHMGRVNSYRRLKRARELGCDTADGTFLAFGPDANLPHVLKWMIDIQDVTDWKSGKGTP
jgi:hypothetical protein